MKQTIIILLLLSGAVLAQATGTRSGKQTVGTDLSTFTVTPSGQSTAMTLSNATRTDLVNVKKPPFNAFGDSSHDDTAAIQAALDAAGIAGQVFFPAGQYKITATVNVHDGQTLIGVSGGLGATPTDLTKGTVIYAPSFASTFFKIDVGARFVTIDGFKFWGKDTNGNVAGSVGIAMQGASGNLPINQVRIHNCAFWRIEKGVKGEDLDASGYQVSNVYITDSNFTENTFGVWIKSNNADYWLIDNSTMGTIQANGAGVWVEKGGDVGIRNTTASGFDTSTTSFVVINGVHSPILVERSQAESIGFFLKVTSTGGQCSPNGCLLTLIANVMNATTQVDNLENVTFIQNQITAPVNLTNNVRTVSLANSFTGTGAYAYSGNSSAVAALGDATASTSSSGGHWAVFDAGGQVWHTATQPYSASMTPDARLARDFVILASNGTAFTINAPTNVYPTLGQHISFTIKNTSGGALGIGTWAAGYHMAGAWTQPLNGQFRTIEFRYDGTNWLEMWRSAADAPN